MAGSDIYEPSDRQALAERPGWRALVIRPAKASDITSRRDMVTAILDIG